MDGNQNGSTAKMERLEKLFRKDIPKAKRILIKVGTSVITQKIVQLLLEEYLTLLNKLLNSRKMINKLSWLLVEQLGLVVR